jgi:hypothetical protein
MAGQDAVDKVWIHCSSTFDQFVDASKKLLARTTPKPTPADLHLDLLSALRLDWPP